jgi:hypothetical protein
MHCARINIGNDPEGVDMAVIARLNKDGLPDSTGGSVPAPLFADGLLVVIHWILDAQHQ